MARPPAKELTERELEVMHAFWHYGQATANEVRDELEKRGTNLAYVTVANLVRTLVEKGFLAQINLEKPYCFRAIRSFDEVSRSLVGDLVDRLFGGSHEQLLVNLLGRKRLTPHERNRLQELLREEPQK